MSAISLEQRAERALRGARTIIALDHRFYAAGAMQLELVPAPGIGTMGTDGVILAYDPAWVLKLVESGNAAQLRGVVAHEVMHVLHCHHTRRPAWRAIDEWNIDCDYSINNLLLAEGFELPPGGCIDRQYAGMTAERIAALRKARSQHGGNKPGDGPGTAGRPSPSAAPGQIWDMRGSGTQGQATKEEKAAEEQRQEIAIIQATQAAVAAGKCPAWAEEMARAIRAPQVDWRAALRQFLTAYAKEDYSWRRPNQRHLASGDYLPSLYSEACGPIAEIMDISGSVSAAERAAFAGEMLAIAAETRPERLIVMNVDAAVQSVAEYEAGDLPESLDYPASGGGTSFQPAWDKLAELGEAPVCAVYLTDGYPNDGWGKDPGYPVIWVSTGATEAPYGDVIKINIGAAP